MVPAAAIVPAANIDIPDKYTVVVVLTFTLMVGQVTPKNVNNAEVPLDPLYKE